RAAAVHCVALHTPAITMPNTTAICPNSTFVPCIPGLRFLLRNTALKDGTTTCRKGQDRCRVSAGQRPLSGQRSRKTHEFPQGRTQEKRRQRRRVAACWTRKQEM